MTSTGCSSEMAASSSAVQPLYHRSWAEESKHQPSQTSAEDMTRKKFERHGTKCRECAVNEVEGVLSDIRQRDIINSLYAPQEALHPSVFPELYTLSSA